MPDKDTFFDIRYTPYPEGRKKPCIAS